MSDEKNADPLVELAKAEAELFAWATGQRSWTNQQMDAEFGTEYRSRTLVEIAQRDEAELGIAIKRVQALRLLTGGATHVEVS